MAGCPPPVFDVTSMLRTIVEESHKPASPPSSLESRLEPCHNSHLQLISHAAPCLTTACIQENDRFKSVKLN